jgi:holo-[acyl-carrier protein] synthase
MIGIDIVENRRIEELLNKHGENFLKKVFFPSEVEYCKSFKDFIPCLAARWAVKEAVIKAFFQTFGILLSLKNIEVLGRKGSPAEVKIHGIGKEILEKEKKHIWISLSHEKNYSVAVAMVCSRGRENF